MLFPANSKEGFYKFIIFVYDKLVDHKLEYKFRNLNKNKNKRKYKKNSFYKNLSFKFRIYNYMKKFFL